MSKKPIALLSVIVIFFAFFSSGCAIFQKAQKADELEGEVASLKRQLAQLEQDKKQVVVEKEKEVTDLDRAKQDLERQLKKEIGEYRAKLEMTERGLVITFLSEVFFDSGKYKIKSEGAEALKKVAEVLNHQVSHSSVAIEGHTDNAPIVYSGWKSNWELSSARALAVLHFFIDNCKVRPERLSANAFGECHPVVKNDSPGNMQRNRRVEIVILPSQVKKVKAEEQHLLNSKP